MLECLNAGLEGLGGLESLEFRGKRCPFSNSNSHLELTIDVASVWYFITICAKDHAPWSMRDDRVGRDDPRPYSIAVTRDSISVGRDDPIAPDEFKKVLSTKAQLAKCVAYAEKQIEIGAKWTFLYKVYCICLKGKKWLRRFCDGWADVGQIVV